MRLYKLKEIIETLENIADGSVLHSMLVANAGMELTLYLNSQPNQRTHDFLISKGFILTGDAYIYMPPLKTLQRKGEGRK